MFLAKRLPAKCLATYWLCYFYKNLWKNPFCLLQIYKLC